MRRNVPPVDVLPLSESTITPAETSAFERWLAVVDSRCWTLADVTLCEVIDRTTTAGAATYPGFIRQLVTGWKRGQIPNAAAVAILDRMQRFAD